LDKAVCGFFGVCGGRDGRAVKPLRTARALVRPGVLVGAQVSREVVGSLVNALADMAHVCRRRRRRRRGTGGGRRPRRSALERRLSLQRCCFRSVQLLLLLSLALLLLLLLQLLLLLLHNSAEVKHGRYQQV